MQSLHLTLASCRSPVTWMLDVRLRGDSKLDVGVRLNGVLALQQTG